MEQFSVLHIRTSTSESNRVMGLLIYPFNGIITMLLGKNGETLGKELFNIIDTLDIVVKGEADEFIVDLVDRVFESTDIKGFPYIYVKDSEGIYCGEGVGRVENVDSLPVPAYELLEDTLKWIEIVNKMPMNTIPVAIRTSYGCPRHFYRG